MARPKIDVAPELIAAGRRLYEQTDTPLDEIAAHMGMRRRTLNNRIIEWNWTRRRYARSGIATEPAAAVSAIAASAPIAAPETSETLPAEPPVAFAERLRRVIDAQMQVAERTLKVLAPASSAEAERTARVLATVSRTVQEIKATGEGRTPANETDDDPVPVDIDEFRLALADRIEAFVAHERSAADGEVSSNSGDAAVE